MVRFHLASFERYTMSLVVAMGLRDERADSLFAIRTEVVRRQSLDLESEALRVFDALGLVMVGGPARQSREVENAESETRSSRGRSCRLIRQRIWRREAGYIHEGASKV